MRWRVGLRGYHQGTTGGFEAFRYHAAKAEGPPSKHQTVVASCPRNRENHLAKRRFHQGRSWWLNISDAKAAASRFDLSSWARCVCRISPAVGYQLGMFLTVSVFLDILFTAISGCYQSGKKRSQPLFDRVVPYLSPNLHGDSAKNI